MHSPFRCFFFHLFILNAGHAIDRPQPINKMNARIQCTHYTSTTCVRVCLPCAIVSQLTKYGITHSNSVRAACVRRFHFIHVCREKSFPTYLNYVFVVCIRCQTTCVVSSARQWRDDMFALHFRWFLSTFVYSPAGDQCWMLNISSVKCAWFVDRKAKSRFSAHSLPTRHRQRWRRRIIVYFGVEMKTIVFGNWCQICSQGSRDQRRATQRSSIVYF